MSAASRTYRIVVADDSSLYRHILPKVLNAAPHLDVVGVAADGQQAVELVDEHRPDGVVLDLNMPRLNGFEAMEQILRRHTLPVIMISAGAAKDGQLAVQAVSRGAVDLFVKPAASPNTPLSEGLGRLASIVEAACRGTPRKASTRASQRTSPARHDVSCDLIVIGASTGGISALSAIIKDLDDRTPPIVFAQHMPQGFTASLCQQLAHDCKLTIVESRPSMPLRPGHLVVCTTNDLHTVVRRSKDGAYRLAQDDGPKEHHQRPAVDPLFRSAAKAAGRRALGILLTGMGRDGASGLLAMRQAGAPTIAESDETAVVFGMPRAAIELGAAQQTLSLDQIKEELSARKTGPSPVEEISR